MGNYTSCCVLRGGDGSRKSAAILFDADGSRRRKVPVPVTAAEVMLEEDLHAVVVPLDDLRRTRRILPMRADDELVGGKVYLLMPPGRVNSKVAESEIEALESGCRRQRRGRRARRGGVSRVSPAVEEEKGEDGWVGGVSGMEEGDLMGQQNRRIYWKPALHSISEMASCA